MGRKGRTPLRALVDELARRHPELEDPSELVASGRIAVDGRVVTNPRSLVRQGAAIAIRHPQRLRGEIKLAAALETFRVPVAGRVAVDVGAAAGGFTRALLDAGAARIYAVDAGFGQLLGSLRQDARVVVLERVNVAELRVELVPDEVEVVTVDLSYLAVAAAVPQLERLRLARDADLIALVKPMYELGLAAPPEDAATLARALAAARAGVERSGWRAVADVRSPVRGARGAVELLLHARRVSSGGPRGGAA